MEGNKYVLKVRKTILQKKGNEVLQALSSGSAIAGQLIISTDKVTNRLVVYLGEIGRKNIIIKTAIIFIK